MLQRKMMVGLGRVQDNQENVWRKQSLYFDLRLSRTYSTLGAVLDNKYKKKGVPKVHTHTSS